MMKLRHLLLCVVAVTAVLPAAADVHERYTTMVSDETKNYVSKRPPVEERLFKSVIIEQRIRDVFKLIKGNPKLAWMFVNCFPNTLDSTVHYRLDENGDDDTFVYTGDIHAMWLRDSGAQVWPYVKYAREDEKLRHMLRGVILRQLKCIVLDPYHYTASLVEMVHDDFNLIMLISSIFVFLLLLVSYKNLWISLIAFAPMMISWYTVLGAMAIFGQTFNMINVVISSFIFGIGVDYSIFIMDGLRKQHSDGADDKTIVYHKTAITISGTVLCICMFSLFFAKHPALHSIAFASLVGMITTIMLSYTLQPNLYRLYVKLKTGKKPATK